MLRSGTISAFQNAVFLYTLLGYVCKSVKISGIDHDVSGSGIHANSMKALVTDMIRESAQLYVQLSGAKGYRMSHIGDVVLWTAVRSRFFEGSNEMLYTPDCRRHSERYEEKKRKTWLSI